MTGGWLLQEKQHQLDELEKRIFVVGPGADWPVEHASETGGNSSILDHFGLFEVGKMNENSWSSSGSIFRIFQINNDNYDHPMGLGVVESSEELNQNFPTSSAPRPWLMVWMMWSSWMWEVGPVSGADTFSASRWTRHFFVRFFFWLGVLFFLN